MISFYLGASIVRMICVGRFVPVSLYFVVSWYNQSPIQVSALSLGAKTCAKGAKLNISIAEVMKFAIEMKKIAQHINAIGR